MAPRLRQADLAATPCRIRKNRPVDSSTPAKSRITSLASKLRPKMGWASSTARISSSPAPRVSLFPGKADKEVGDQVKVPGKPAVRPAAGLVVEEEVPEAADQVKEQGEAQQTGDIGDEQGGKDLPGGGGGLVPCKAADAAEEPRQQGDGQRLKKVPRVGVEKEIGEGHGRDLLGRSWPQYTRESGRPH